MAKPNLTSIFTSTNQYSVLKLLKALCDAVDNIDYTDNTEFTKFKEQINSAVNSLEQSIMNNENAISDLNTVTGNNSVEINSIKKQIRGINTDANGNVAVGKNLEVDGNVFTLNGKQWGIMPVCTDIDNAITNKGYIIYSEKPRISSPATNITVFKCRGIYLDEGGYVYIFSYSPSATNISIENDTLYIKSYDAYTSFINSALNVELAQNEISQIKNKQSTLYRHNLIITARYEEGADPFTCIGRVVIISSNNLVVDSLQNLTNLLNPTNGYTYPLDCPANKDGFGYSDYSLLSYLNNIWYIECSNPIEIPQLPIAEVSDTVTPL